MLGVAGEMIGNIELDAGGVRLVASITMDSADASSPRVVARALTLVRCGLSAVAPNFTA